MKGLRAAFSHHPWCQDNKTPAIRNFNLDVKKKADQPQMSLHSHDAELQFTMNWIQFWLRSFCCFIPLRADLASISLMDAEWNVFRSYFDKQRRFVGEGRKKCFHQLTLLFSLRFVLPVWAFSESYGRHGDDEGSLCSLQLRSPAWWTLSKWNLLLMMLEILSASDVLFAVLWGCQTTAMC